MSGWSLPAKLSQSWAVHRATDFASRIADPAFQFVEAGSNQARNIASASLKLRERARTLLNVRWLDDTGEPTPVLAQINMGIDSVAVRAREMMS